MGQFSYEAILVASILLHACSFIYHSITSVPERQRGATAVTDK